MSLMSCEMCEDLRQNSTFKSSLSLGEVQGEFTGERVEIERFVVVS